MGEQKQQESLNICPNCENKDEIPAGRLTYKTPVTKAGRLTYKTPVTKNECEACDGTGKMTDEELEQWEQKLLNFLEEAFGSDPVENEE